MNPTARHLADAPFTIADVPGFDGEFAGGPDDWADATGSPLER